MPADGDARVDELFGAPPEEFVARRDALAKALKAEGDKEAAAAVKALRRPTVAAWAVNQAVRTIEGKNDVAALLQVGDRLRDAHDALLEGRGDGAIREATAERRALVAKLTRQAVAALGPAGDAQRDAITHTFDAAVVDPEAGLEVRAGRLSKELDAPSGFGGGLVFGGGSAEATPRRERGSPSRRAGRRERDGDAPPPAPEAAPAVDVGAAVDREAAREAAKAAERRRKELQRDAEDRAAEAAEAAREAAAAHQEVLRLRDLLAAAETAAEAAADRVRRAESEAAAAQQARRDAAS